MRVYRHSLLAGRAALVGLVLSMAPGRAPGAEPLLLADSPNTFLVVRGPLSLSGEAPLPLGDLSVGDYSLNADGPGLPSVRGRLTLEESQRLTARAWSGPLALLYPPGLVHLERGEKRGWLFAASALSSAAMLYRTLGDLSDAEDDVDRAGAAYAGAVSQEAIQEARAELDAATQRRDNEEELRGFWTGYLAATWVGAALECWMLTPQPTLNRQGAHDYQLSLPHATWWKAGVRSLLVPGSGQRYMGATTRAGLFSFGVAAAGFAALVTHDAFLDARRDQVLAQSRYDRAETPGELQRARAALEDAAEKVDDRDVLRWVLVGVTGSLYAWNVLDAIREGGSARGASSGESADQDLSLGILPDHDGLHAVVTWSLP